MKAMKFKVKDKEHSEAIQAKLFELGYCWGLRQPKFEYTDAQALYAGYFGGNDITYSYDLDSFEDIGNYNCEEYILSPLGTFVKAADYYKQPKTPKLNIPERYENPQNEEDKMVKDAFDKIIEMLTPLDGTEALITKQKAVADKILDKLFSIDPFAIVAGGAPRDWHFGKPAADIDVFFYSPVDQLIIVSEMLRHVGINIDNAPRTADNLPEWYKLNPNLKAVFETNVDGVNVQIMLMIGKTQDTVVPEFPFSICKAWYKHGSIQLDAEFKKCERHKIVVQTNKLYSDEHKYVQKMKNKFPDWEFFSNWEAAYKYVFEKGV